MKDIKFTQYMRPNGRQVPMLISRPEKIATKAQGLIQAGYELECEVTMTNLVSLSISDGEVDCAIEICKNGPAVLAAVDNLIMDFNPATLGASQ